LYLFTKHNETINAFNIYQSLTLNEKMDLTQNKLNQYFANIESTNANIEALVSDLKTKFKQIPNDKVYSYKEFITLFSNIKTNIEVLINKPFGQKLLPDNNLLNYVVNPYDLDENNKTFLEKPIEKVITTTNQSLLLSFGEIHENMIYFCTAAEVLQAQQAQQAQQQLTYDPLYNLNLMKIYFPFLIDIDIGNDEKIKITTLESISENKQNLMIKTEEMLDNIGFKRNNQNIELFYNLYNERKSELNYIKKGIQRIEFIINPAFTFSLQLDSIFKLIHATQKIPLIKYNPAKRLEKIYRLYTNKVATNGKKIPYLPLKTINKLIKGIGKKKGVAVYITSETYKIICEFQSNGSIIVSTNFDEIMDFEMIEEIIKENVNPVIEIVKEYIEQSGYNLNTFQSLNSADIEILTMDYAFDIIIDKNLKLNKMMGCLYSIFSISNAAITNDEYTMRYKRVSNYNEMNDQEAFITDSLNQQNTEEDIIEGLKINFKLTQDEAILILTNFTTTNEISQKAFKTIKLKKNPGFLTTIKRDKSSNVLTINVSGINDIMYLQTIPIYIDSILRITQSSSIDKKYNIKELCNKKEEIVEVDVEDIIANKEESFIDRDDTIDIIQGETIILLGETTAPLSLAPSEAPSEAALEEEISEEKKERIRIQKSYFDIMFNEDDDDDDDNDEEEASSFSGGATKKSNVNFKLPSEADPSELSEAFSETETETEALSEAEEELGKEKLQVEWTGKTLTHPNPFYKRLIEREPSLIITKSEGKFNSYTTSCPWSEAQRRQPVILTQEEKDNIDKNHPGSYDHALEYGSDPNNKYWYICPRYWSLRDNASLTEEQVKSGKYGKLIPKDASKVGEGENIIEINSKYNISNKSDEYKYLNPGFMDNDKHPDGKCIPCCFTNWDSPKQKERREECGVISEETPAAAALGKKISKKSSKKDTLKSIALKAPTLLEQEPALAPIQQVLAVVPEAPIQQALLPEAPIQKASAVQQAPVVLPEVPIQKAQSPKQAPVVQQIIERKNSDIDKNYIKNAEKFPLNQNEYGYLPIAVQKFLHTDNKKCQISISNANLKLNHTCFLRHGVETHKSQSFIACIADIWYLDNNNILLSIREMKEKLISIMSIDFFTTLQNGNLVDMFEESSNPSTSEAVASESEAPIGNALKFIQDENRKKKIETAYENFKKFLRDDNVEINYTYLWDLICQPNKKLFIKGINLVILEMKDDDITDNIEIICPANHYSSSFFDVNKRCIILLKNGNYFEPIYTREDTLKENIVNRSFSLKYKNILPNLKTTLELIKKSLNEKCGGLPSLPNVYKFDKNIVLKQLISLLTLKKYTIEKQVIHYNGKTIGVVINKTFSDGYKGRGMIPCYPSAPILDMDFIWMDADESYTMPYKETIDFLNKVNKDIKIPCKPKLKVSEDALIIGIITQANQFITISQPQQDIYGTDSSNEYALPMIESNSNSTPSEVDKTIFTSDDNKVDNERVEFIKNIRMETDFYNVFRNTIRTILGEFKNREIKEEIEKISATTSSMLYLEKLRLLTELLKKLMYPKIVKFVDYTPELNNSGITSCYKNEKEKCQEKEYCSLSDQEAEASASETDTSETDTSETDTSAADKADTCALVIPKINLINGQENEKIYFGRIADELIRYNRIKTFIFQPKAFLTLSKLNYNLRDDEIILLQSLLTPEYFKDLIQKETNPYLNETNSNTYDTAQPMKSSVDYSNKIILEEDELIQDEIKCEGKTPKKFESLVWSKEVFKNKKTIELTYNASKDKNNNICSFELILDLIKTNAADAVDANALDTTNLTKENLKELLIDEYEKFIENKNKYKTELLDVLKLEGKKLMVNQILTKQITFEEMIQSADYYATILDMWLLAERFNVPIVFISSTKLVENDELNLVTKIQQLALAETDEEEDDEEDIRYFFIKVPAIGVTSIDKIPEYDVIFINEAAPGEPAVSTKRIPLSILDAAEANPNVKINNKPVSVEEFLLEIRKKNKIPKMLMTKKPKL